MSTNNVHIYDDLDEMVAVIREHQFSLVDEGCVIEFDDYPELLMLGFRCALKNTAWRIRLRDLKKSSSPFTAAFKSHLHKTVLLDFLNNKIHSLQDFNDTLNSLK